MKMSPGARAAAERGSPRLWSTPVIKRHDFSWTLLGGAPFLSAAVGEWNEGWVEGERIVINHILGVFEVFWRLHNSFVSLLQPCGPPAAQAPYSMRVENKPISSVDMLILGHFRLYMGHHVYGMALGGTTTRRIFAGKRYKWRVGMYLH